MTLPVCEPSFWKERLENATRPHHSIFLCTQDVWNKIEAKHTEILARIIEPWASVIDCGCGYGDILDLMPSSWIGPYLGVDISPHLLMKALTTPHRQPGAFLQADLRELSKKVRGYGRTEVYKFDWAIIRSMRGMIQRNVGHDVWGQMELEIRKVARQLLYLEYNDCEEGSIE